MGVLRKGLWIGTGGLSGAAGVKANSKKERTAKALEKQNRLLQRAGGSDSEDPPLSSLADELTKFTALHDQGVIGDDEFETIKARLVGQVMEQVVERPDPKAKLCVECGAEVERWPDWKWKLCEPCLGKRWAAVAKTGDGPPKGLVGKITAAQAQIIETREADLAALRDAGVSHPERKLKRQNNRKVLLEPLGLKSGQTKRQKKEAAQVTEAPHASNELPPAQWAPDPTGENDLRFWDGERWTDHVSPVN